MRPSANEPPRQRWRVLGHDSRLGQVFNNLIDNARSFSTPGGDRARACCWPERAQRARRPAARRAMRSSSTTTGRAFRTTRSSASSNASTPIVPNRASARTPGLGLSISRQIIEAHGGRIRALNRTRRAARGHGSAAPRTTRCSARASSSGCRRRDERRLKRRRRAMIHANALLSASPGVLLRGPSGAGKSALTLQLIADCAGARRLRAARRRRSRLARTCATGRLIARPHPAIAGAHRGARARACCASPYEPAGVHARCRRSACRRASDAAALAAGRESLRLNWRRDAAALCSRTPAAPAPPSEILRSSFMTL